MTVALEPRIGAQAMLLAMLPDEEQSERLASRLKDLGYRVVHGRVGAMDGEKVVAAMESAVKRARVIDGRLYREGHALYHAILDALHGVARGPLMFGEIHRTVGLKFAVVRGPGVAREPGDWIAVALYGMIGAPAKGFEHEALGLGVFHI
ncbi:HutP family protein [Alicyclobacillus sp.]|uniref:HutP family protein n=1 Tax=Alicyclobacillus sp. TaxID=61169 RepID=UPI0025C17375|nr:HutP family protein [Alicyclobacillus sp.]